MPDITIPLIAWLVTGGFLAVLIKCLAVCPGIPQLLLGLAFEARWVPLNPRYQFLAYFPGNPFLALFIAGCSTTFDQPGPDGFWQSALVNGVVFWGAFCFYVVLNTMDLRSNYTREQMASATKRYHNALYFWYGYLTVVCCITMLASTAPWADKALIMVPGLLWLGCLIGDSFLTSAEVLEVRFKTAHAENKPIWTTGWRLRRRTEEGYVLMSRS